MKSLPGPSEYALTEKNQNATNAAALLSAQSLTRRATGKETWERPAGTDESSMTWVMVAGHDIS